MENKTSFEVADKLYNELTTQDRLLCNEDIVAASELMLDETGWSHDELLEEQLNRIMA